MKNYEWESSEISCNTDVTNQQSCKYDSSDATGKTKPIFCQFESYAVTAADGGVTCQTSCWDETSTSKCSDDWYTATDETMYRVFDWQVLSKDDDVFHKMSLYHSWSLNRNTPNFRFELS